MEGIVELKFRQHDDLREELLSTRDAILVFVSLYDPISHCLERISTLRTPATILPFGEMVRMGMGGMRWGRRS